MNACTKIKGSKLKTLCERAVNGIMHKREKEVEEKVQDCQKEFIEEIENWNQSFCVRVIKMSPKINRFDSLQAVYDEMDRRFSKERSDEWGDISTRYLRKGFYGRNSGWENRIKRFLCLGIEFPDQEIEIETETLGSICEEAKGY